MTNADKSAEVKVLCQTIPTFTEHLSSVKRIAISPDGQTLVSGGSDETVKVWNLHTGELICQWQLGQNHQTLESPHWGTEKYPHWAFNLG
jgi:FOG: WD40 repeat